MEKSKEEKKPPLISSQPDQLSQEEEEGKGAPQLTLSSIKPESSKDKRGSKGIKERYLAGLDQQKLQFSREYDYDPTKAVEESKVDSVFQGGPDSSQDSP